MRPIRVVAISAIVVCAGCADADLSPLPRSAEPWRLSGTVVEAGSQRPLPGQTVVISRFQTTRHWCLDCAYTGVDFTVRTDERGRFEFSSQLPGEYGVHLIFRNHTHCAESVSLGKMRSQERTLRIVARPGPCPIIL